MNYLYLSTGGILGVLARYLFGGLIHRWLGVGFPYGTFAVNLSGCFVIGLAAALAGERIHDSDPLKHFFFIGFLGAYTTFSSYMFESFSLIERGEWAAGLGYLVGSVLLGYLALFAGVALGRAL